MNTSATIKSEQTKPNAAVKDLALKPGQDVRGGVTLQDFHFVMRTN